MTGMPLLVRGAVFAVLLVGSAFIAGVVCLPVPVLLMLVPNNTTLRWSRWLANTIEKHYIVFACIVVEKYAGTKVVITGDLPANDAVCILASNHRCHVDWMYIWSLTLRSDSMHALRVVLKESLKSVPILGWVMQALLFIFLSRDRTQDVPHISKMTAHGVNTGAAPPTFLIFPEGTDLSKSNLVKANKWGAENGLEPREQVLHPRVTGLLAMLNAVPKDKVKLYDVTMAYRDFSETQRTSEASFIFGRFPREVHIDVREVTRDNTPRTRQEVETWLKQSFNRKEALLKDFYSGKTQSLVPVVPNVNLDRRVRQTMQQGLILGIVLGALVLYGLYAFAWFRWYCAIAIAGFTLTTALTKGIDYIDLGWHGRRVHPHSD